VGWDANLLIKLYNKETESQYSLRKFTGFSQCHWLCESLGVTPAASGGKKRFWGELCEKRAKIEGCGKRYTPPHPLQEIQEDFAI
jgi:hypothetical protein